MNNQELWVHLFLFLSKNMKGEKKCRQAKEMEGKHFCNKRKNKKKNEKFIKWLAKKWMNAKKRKKLQMAHEWKFNCRGENVSLTNEKHQVCDVGFYWLSVVSCLVWHVKSLICYSLWWMTMDNYEKTNVKIPGTMFSV